jgi:hypothetical protein
MPYQRKLGIWEAWLRSHASPPSGLREGKAVPARPRWWRRLLASLHRATSRWCGDHCDCIERGMELCADDNHRR